MLRDKYFYILDKVVDGNAVDYVVKLNPTHEIYNGHFPGNPVSPGVCSIQMIRECCEDTLGTPLKISAINLCRFLSVLTPDKGDNLHIKISIDEEEPKQYKITASIDNSETTYVSLKGLLTSKA